MSMRTRALIFSTFLGSCLAIGLLLVSLTTNHWVRAYPKRRNADKSNGQVNLGLFYGNKDLNSGVGVRSTPFIVYTFDENGPETMNFWLWLITALGTGFGLLSCAIAAIAAVLKSASAAKRQGTMVLLFASNISAAVAQVVAFVCWLVQFYQYLRHNVLAVSDTNWHSHDLVYLGYSFYLVIASTLVVLMNIVILIYAKRRDRRDRQRHEPIPQEKNQSAIMLY